MSEANKARVRRFIEAIVTNRNLQGADELLAPTYIDHRIPPGIAATGEGFKQFAAALRSAFPDLQTTVEDLVAEGDKVAARWSSRGTHQGQFMALAPTGRSFNITGTDIFRIEGGRIVEHWSEVDQLGLFQQLGVIPAPGQSAS